MEFYEFMVSIVVGIAICVIVVLSFSSVYGERVRKHLPLLICAALIPLVLASSIVILPTGYTGVRSTFGQIDPVTVQSGLNWKVPLVQSIEKVNNKQQDIHFDSQVWSETKQRTAIYYEHTTVTYRINSEKSAWIYANVADYKNSLINEGIVQSALKSSSKELTDIDATNRSIIEPLCLSYLQKSLDDKYGEDVVLITKVIIGNADFDESYNEAIAAKQQAQIDAERQAIENERNIAKAEAEATVARTQANARADVAIIEAKGLAEANETIKASLSDEVIAKMWLEKWNGELPEYVSGEAANSLIGIGFASE